MALLDVSFRRRKKIYLCSLEKILFDKYIRTYRIYGP